MSEDKDYLMKQRRKEVLAADRWRCRMCEMPIDSSGSSEDEKDSHLKAHIHDNHINSPLFNQDIKEDFLVLYFKPIVQTIQSNEKF